MLADEILSRLEILPLENLKMHEQVIPENLDALREKMLNLGRLVDPLIVDNKNHIVLDGNHRKQVLEILKADNAVCQMVDYSSPEIKIGGWHIATNKINPEDVEGEKTDKATGIKALQKMDASFMLISKKGKKEECTLIPSPKKDLHAIAKSQDEFLKNLFGIENSLTENNHNGHIIFIEDSRLEYFLKNGYSVFTRRIFTKKEVVKEASAGRPLPPKSTRHMIPNRIVRLNFRLGYLNETPANAQILLREMVKKRVKYGSARYYTEPVIVLY
ncbi:MAG: hypothetical protein ABIH83_04040 [Candidatus Micrarchaeota archaeon]